MTPNEFKLLTSTRWNEKYEPLTFDTKDKNTRRCRLRLDSILFLIQILFITQSEGKTAP